MAIGRYLTESLAAYASGKDPGRFRLILAECLGECRYSAQEIMDECALQVGTMYAYREADRKKEQRLRKLVAIIMSMREVGLIE